jgi:hypothetical protein
MGDHRVTPSSSWFGVLTISVAACSSRTTPRMSGTIGVADEEPRLERAVGPHIDSTERGRSGDRVDRG